MNRVKGSLLLKVVLVIAVMSIAASAYAFTLGRVLKVGVIAVVVDSQSSRLDSFINNLTGNRNLGVDVDTKVVPIISVGSGAYIGAAQVMGPKDAVDRTQAVAQIEGRMTGTFRVKALVPVSSRSGDLSRVKGVGVGAVIDVRI